MSLKLGAFIGEVISHCEDIDTRRISNTAEVIIEAAVEIPCDGNIVHNKNIKFTVKGLRVLNGQLVISATQI